MTTRVVGQVDTVVDPAVQREASVKNAAGV
jgi:hypothetical protein